MVLGVLEMFLPEVSLRCCVRIGISSTLLSPCGFGLFSDISLPDRRPRGELPWALCALPYTTSQTK